MHQTILLTRIYDDAMRLLHEARGYIQENGPMDFFSASVDQGVSIATETTRITSRLTHILTWFLMQKALLKGEIDLSEARSDDYRIDLVENLMDDTGEVNPVVSSTLRAILRDSRQLYERVARLDSLFRKNTAHEASSRS